MLLYILQKYALTESYIIFKQLLPTKFQDLILNGTNVNPTLQVYTAAMIVLFMGNERARRWHGF